MRTDASDHELFTAHHRGWRRLVVVGNRMLWSGFEHQRRCWVHFASAATTWSSLLLLLLIDDDGRPAGTDVRLQERTHLLVVRWNEFLVLSRPNLIHCGTHEKVKKIVAKESAAPAADPLGIYRPCNFFSSFFLLLIEYLSSLIPSPVNGPHLSLFASVDGVGTLTSQQFALPWPEDGSGRRAESHRPAHLQ